MSRRQFGRDLNLDSVEMIAGRASLETGDTESLDPKGLVVLGSRWNLDDGVPLEGGDFHFSAEHRRDEVDRDVALDIEAFPLKDRMGLNSDRHVEVAGGTRIGPMLAFIGEPEPHSGFYSGRNVNGNRPFLVSPLPTLAGGAGFRHNLTGAFALTAWPADAEESLLETELPSAFAAGADLDGRRRFRSGSFTVVAYFPAWDLELRLFAVYRFFEGKFQVVLKIVAPFRPASTTGLSEEILEDIVKGISETPASKIKTFESSGTLLRPGMTEHVVAFPLLLVAQGFVRFVDLFELFFGCFLLMIAGLQIWMVLAGQFPVGFLELVVGNGFLDAENIVVISFSHGCHCSYESTERPSSHVPGNSVCLLDILCYFLSLSTSSNSASTTFSSVLVLPAPSPPVPAPCAPVAEAAFLYISSASLCEAVMSV